ncbi:MAG: glycoside hydrolase family 3 N-terminal domain-containing protein [Clostridia bacterium]
MRKLGWILCALTLLAGLYTGAAKGAVGGEASAALEQKITAVMSRMTLEEKVCQLFFVRPEDFCHVGKVQKASNKLESAFHIFPVGGVVLFPINIKNGNQLLALNQAMQGYAQKAHGIGLLIGVDEEGGGVARVANKLAFKNAAPAMSEVGESGDAQAAYAVGAQIGSYLNGYGFTLDFAPVADVRTSIKKAEISQRCFGDDEKLVSEMVSQFVRGLQEQRVLAVLKHFPGLGAVSGNSHNGRAISTRTVAQWHDKEWLPFRAGIEAGAQVVMMSHQLAAAVDAKSPASLSYRIVTELLRGSLGFNGVVITDALRMNAITDQYSSGEACVQALLAGCDMLLLPKNFSNGYNGVLKAVEEKRLTQERIEESVRRILRLKAENGLLELEKSGV